MSDGTLVDQPTPAAVVDLDVLDGNVAAMAARAREAGVVLRPHAKTHKSVEVVRRQLAAGAVGVTVATVEEAETFAGAGVQDIFLAYPPVGAWRCARLAAIAAGIRLTVAADDIPSVLALDACFHAAGVSAGYLWEVDCGLGRCGTAPGAVTADLVEAVHGRTSALGFSGLTTFAGHAYEAQDPEALRTIAREELEAVRETERELHARGIDVPVISFGSTPTAHQVTHDSAGYEMRPGNYVFYDASQVALGVVGPESCALTVLATVVSRPDAGHLVLDCGSKSLSTDRMSPRTVGLGVVRDHPDVLIERLFEEHAIASVSGRCDLAVGDRVHVIPNHSCAVANLQGRLVVVQDDAVVDRWEVRARRGLDA